MYDLTLDSTNKPTSGSIFRSIRSTKVIHLRGPSLFQSCPVYCVQNIQTQVTLNLTQMLDWEGIDLTSFKRVQDMTTIHIARVIMKCMSNTLPTTANLQRQGKTTTNLFLNCGLAPDTIQHMYQFTHEGLHLPPPINHHHRNQPHRQGQGLCHQQQHR